MDRSELLSHVDHTLLRPDATWGEIRQLCDEALKYHTASVCVPPSYVTRCANYLRGRIPVCTVVGFPNGYNTTKIKAFEAAEAVQNGADEIDMVINLGWVKDYIKTSTGFSSGGATREDVALFAENIGPAVKIKAAGGISTLQDAEDFLALGADRLGTSRIVKLIMEEEGL